MLAAATLAVYKPRGRTPYGARKEADQPIEKAPRWVKVSGAAATALILLLAVMLLGGGHGPGAHMP